MKKGEGTCKVYTHVKGNGNENIIIKTYYYNITVVSGSTNSIGWHVSLVVKNAENNVYGNKAATNRANMIPPSGVQTDYPLGQKKMPAPKSLDKNH